MVRRAGPPVFGGAVDFAQAADADGFAEVDVSGYGGGAGVEPDKWEGEAVSFGGVGWFGIGRGEEER